MAYYLRNLETGAIKTVEPDSDEFAKAKAERTKDGRFPLWEQTSQDDADPREDYEVRNRSQWDAKLHDVTTDGVRQSGPNAVGLVDADAEAEAFASAKDTSSTSSSAKSSK